MSTETSPKPDFSYDVVIIGAGPGGEASAMALRKNGKRVAMVEKRPKLGGNCAHKGTIPSKALRHVVKQIIHFNDSPIFSGLIHQENSETRWLPFPRVMRAATEVIGKQVDKHTEFYNRNRVPVHFGSASFLDKNTLQVIDEDGGCEIIAADDIVIATGSRPYRPDDVDFTHPRVYDSDSILEMQHTPGTMIIYGAGVIGCEYASIFAGLGIKVDLINSRDDLLSFLDEEITDALSYQLRKNGVQVRNREEYDRVETDGSSVTMYFKSGKRLRADALLWSNGRSGNTQYIGLENVGLDANHRGQLTVNDKYQTEEPNIYAVGDVIGWPSLASASYDQGRAVAHAILGKSARVVNNAPTGIYTIPEISSVGKTEKELTEEKVPYEVGRAFFKDTARGHISGEVVGMLKILFHIDTLEILGVHCFGAEAAEIIHIGQAIMSQEGAANTIEFFTNNTFNYPTMAEAYRVAALEGLNKVQRLR